MLRQFALLPPRPGFSTAGFLVSLVIHLAITLPLVLPRPSTLPAEDPIERLVVFLLPPDREMGGPTSGIAIDWPDLRGDHGAIDVAPPTAHTEELLTEGRAGDPDPEETGPAGSPADVAVETALTEIEVDSLVERDPSSAAPVYPADMLAKNLEGSTFVHYVVDTTGRVDTTTIRVIRSTHPAFTRSVRDALALMRFRPAVQNARKVRQWVEQNFAFRILPRVPADTT